MLGKMNRVKIAVVVLTVSVVSQQYGGFENEWVECTPREQNGGIDVDHMVHLRLYDQWHKELGRGDARVERLELLKLGDQIALELTEYTEGPRQQGKYHFLNSLVSRAGFLAESSNMLR